MKKSSTPSVGLSGSFNRVNVAKQDIGTSEVTSDSGPAERSLCSCVSED